MLNDYKIPIFLIPGNHDTMDKKETYNENLFIKYFGQDLNKIQIDNTSFIYFDDSSEKVYKKDLAQIENFIKSKNSKLKFLMFHIPTRVSRPYKHHALHDKNSVKLLEKFIEKNRFDAVFSAHIHSHCFYEIGNIPCYISGEAGSYLILGRDYSFLELSINKNNFKIRRIVVKWEIGLNLIDYFETNIIKYLK